MRNNYDDLQEFIINVIDGLRFNWNAGDSISSSGLNFINTYDISKERIEIHIMSYKANELRISIKDKKENLKSISVNTDKVPNLLSYIAEKQNVHSFQFSGINRQLNEHEFNDLNKITDEVLLKGKFNEKPLIQNEKYPETFDLELNENEKMSFWIQPINNYKLGFQKVVTHIKRLNTGREIGFNR